ncbi:MAG: hypothetical protein HQK70_04930 [Desulfamplus sp.]|nr:hypothetical protein [Desulfamplus sp.]
MQTDNNDAVRKGFIRIWIIWGAMFFSLFIYVALCNILEPTWVALITLDFPIDTLRNVLYGTSIIMFLIGDYIRKYIIKSNSSAQFTRFNQLAAQTNIPASLLKYQTAVIISLAFSESIGIFGLIIFLLSKDIGSLYIFVGSSAAAMLYHIPRISDIH